MTNKRVSLAYNLFANIPATLFTTNPHFDVLFTRYDLAGDVAPSLDGWVRYTLDLDVYREKQYGILHWSFLMMWLGVPHERRSQLATFAHHSKNSTRWWYGSPYDLSNISSDTTRQRYDIETNSWRPL